MVDASIRFGSWCPKCKELSSVHSIISNGPITPAVCTRCGTPLTAPPADAPPTDFVVDFKCQRCGFYQPGVWSICGGKVRCPECNWSPDEL